MSNWMAYAAATKPQFFPNEIAGLTLWLSGSGVLNTAGLGAANGVGVGTWQGIDPTGVPFYQQTVGQRPVMNDPFANGHSSVMYSSAGIGIFASGNTAWASNYITSFVVFSMSASQDSNNPRIIDHNGGNRFQVFISTTGAAPALQTRFGVVGSTTAITLQVSMSANSTVVITSIFDGSGRLYFNGILKKTIALSSGITMTLLTNNAAYGIGNLSSAINRGLSGHICEVIQYNSALPAASQQKVERYLIDKWAIAR